ncbi:MAG: efflux RND transporter permease subunit, partial [Verrucomicrobiota bacterium]
PEAILPAREIRRIDDFILYGIAAADEAVRDSGWMPEDEEGREWNLETAIHGASERLIPIMMTALVTALGLLPLALGSGEAGREIEGPMAQVILGGLISSTVLNLLVLPTLALRWAKWQKAD